MGDYIFYIRPMSAFTAANISGELFANILPLLGSFAPIAAGKQNIGSLLDIDTEVAAKALASGASGISGDKLEALLKKLLVEHRNISFESLNDKKPKPQVLTEDFANQIFCGDVQDMFILAVDVIKINYSGFFNKLDGLFGNLIGGFQNLITKEQSGSKNTAT